MHTSACTVAWGNRAECEPLADDDGCWQEVLRWVMTRAQSHASTVGRAAKHSREERARKLEVRLTAVIRDVCRGSLCMTSVVFYTGQTCSS